MFIDVLTILQRSTTSYSLVRRNSCAFSATMIVDNDISPAAIAGVSVTPHGANTPAASGIATTL